MKKTYVLDTNVLLHDPRSIVAFEDNDVVIPIYVVEEVDTFKKDLSELGRNAREVARELDAAATKAGFKFIDAPVSGGQAGAENGVLTVMCGGDIERGSEVDEEWLLNLERKHFVALAQMPKTQARIAYTMQNGKPLRN